MSEEFAQGIPCLWMRGGTSKGAVFLASDLPAKAAERDQLLLRIMGSPDPRQIDGLGGGDPLASKVAILSRSTREDADVDYLFLQVFVDEAIVTGAQGCGNILAAVGPAAIERGLVPAREGKTPVRIHMVNTGEVASAEIATPNAKVTYGGDATIDGVPGSHAPIALMFENIAGSMCGALLPTGNTVDLIDDIQCTMIDNGMPCLILKAEDLGITGYESREELDANSHLKDRLETIRLKAGPMMNLGDVKEKSVPKMTLVTKPKMGGVINTRCFIPHRCHATIGVFAAITVATASAMKGTTAHDLASLPNNGRFGVEHPSGSFEVFIEQDKNGAVKRAGTLRTARKLMDGLVFPAVRPIMEEKRI